MHALMCAHRLLEACEVVRGVFLHSFCFAINALSVLLILPVALSAELNLLQIDNDKLDTERSEFAQSANLSDTMFNK